jgi:hypothetical protein
MSIRVQDQLTSLLGQSGSVQSRIQQHLNEKPNKPLIEPLTFEAPVEPEKKKTKKLVYLAYTYLGIPHYVEDLKQGVPYFIFNPLGGVEEQFEEEDREELFSIESRIPAEIVKYLPEGLDRKINDPTVISMLRKGDGRSDINAMIFKELFFLVRSSVVLCDLVMEPYGCEMFQKLYFAKMLDIPVIGIAPLGKSVSAYTQKYLKVLLTDDFNVDNILPLLRAYTD